MSIQLKVSNSLEQLSTILSDNLKTFQNNPFSKQIIVTQTEGINSWLKQRIAQKTGIAANIKFCKINDIIAIAYRACGLHYEKDILDQEIMKWSLFDILGEPEFAAAFSDISDYYVSNPIKKIALANELADLFEQYQVYRFETIDRWNTENYNRQEDHQWQRYLWRRLKDKHSAKFEDKSEVGLKLTEAIQHPENKQLLKSRIPEIHLFGLAIIAPYHLRLLNEIGKSVEIYLYITNPAAEEYWLEDKSEKQIAKLLQKNPGSVYSGLIKGNDLLLNWGTIIKNTFSLLFGDDRIINTMEVSTIEPNLNKNTLLSKIQNDIQNNIAYSDSNSYQEKDIKDGSVTINGCYSALREVEVFYNYLLELIDRKGVNISPRDIVVMVSDIDYYAPYIHAVFGNGPQYIPYTVADETITSGNNMFSALKAILNIDTTTFKAEAVLELLDSVYIKKRFKFNDISAVRDAVRQAGICFGTDNESADETYLVSWNYGLKKILYGLCIGGSPTDFKVGDQELIPLDSAEGAEGIERIKLVYFVKVLQFWLKERNTEKTIAEWSVYLKDVLENMVFESGEQDDDDYPKFVSFMDNLASLDEITQHIKVSFEVFRHSLLQQLTLESKSTSFSGAGITFCSLVPMRSVPFRIVGMLGMNFNKFPRKESPLSFSIMQKEKRIGDRNIKDNDKHLFLETIMSTKEYLYISYINKSSKDGSALPSSSIVDELISYVAKVLKKDTESLSEKWITAHPLHGFSQKYFIKDGLVNYLSEDCYKTNIEVGIKTTKEAAAIPTEIKLQDLVLFIQNPPKYFLNKKLGIYYKEQDELIPEHEIFEFDKLMEWSLNNDLLYIEEDKIGAELKIRKLSGAIPLSNMGTAMIEQLGLEQNEVKSIYKTTIEGKTKSYQDIHLNINNLIIKGRIDGLFDHDFVYVCNSGSLHKHILASYIKFLILKLQGGEFNLIFICKNDPGIYEIKASTISQQDAEIAISIIVEFLLQGIQDYFHFYPVLLEGKKFSDDYETFFSMYEDAIDNEKNFDFEDPYLQKAVENGFFDEAGFESLKDNVQTIYGILPPIFQDLINPPKK